MAMFRAGMILLALVLGMSQASAADGWSTFKTRFMTAEGRIQDTGNKNVSHTEGQGYGMLMAVYYNDRSSFDSLWRWTQKNLSNPSNGLFYWKYTPGKSDPVSDKNNASDGDVLIAWALLKAGRSGRFRPIYRLPIACKKRLLIAT